MRKYFPESQVHAMIAFLYKLEVQAKEESQRAADVNPLVITPYLRQLRVSGVPFLFCIFCLKAHPLRWVGLPFTLASIKNKTHGTQSMGFEVIHQPKSRSVLIPCFSVANSSASASAWSFFRGKCFCLCLRYPQN